MKDSEWGEVYGVVHIPIGGTPTEEENEFYS